jgi:hypothetical protein
MWRRQLEGRFLEAWYRSGEFQLSGFYGGYWAGILIVWLLGKGRALSVKLWWSNLKKHNDRFFQT